MFAWKYWDVAIAVVGFFIQCGLAWLGLTLTKWKHITFFAALVIAGAVFTAVAVKRGVDSGNKLQQQLDDIQRKSGATPVVNVSPQVVMPPQHTHAEFFPVSESARDLGFSVVPTLREGEMPEIPISFRNLGDVAIEEPRDVGVLVLVDAKSVNSSFSKYHKQFKFGSPGGTIPARSINAQYHTAYGPSLTRDQVIGIWAGNLYLCGFAAVRWHDITGQYETHFAECLQSEPNHRSFNWHSLKDDNQEHKL